MFRFEVFLFNSSPLTVTCHLILQVMKTSDFQQRRVAAEKFNAENRFLKRGLALIPTKFGISFTTLFLNQARTLRYATFTAPIAH